MYRPSTGAGIYASLEPLDVHDNGNFYFREREICHLFPITSDAWEGWVGDSAYLYLQRSQSQISNRGQFCGTWHASDRTSSGKVQDVLYDCTVSAFSSQLQGTLLHGMRWYWRISLQIATSSHARRPALAWTLWSTHLWESYAPQRPNRQVRAQDALYRDRIFDFFCHAIPSASARHCKSIFSDTLPRALLPRGKTWDEGLRVFAESGVRMAQSFGLLPTI